MIHVDRKRTDEPAVFRSSGAKIERQRAARFFLRTAPSKRAQRRFDFHEDLWAKAVGDLRHLFRNKCAYCETPIDKNADTLVDHFRPLTNAKGLDGSSSAVHYWWLAYEWANLYLVCAACQKAKATQFPVAHSRAKVDTTGKDLSVEGALLLDPCADNPDAYLRFEAGYAKPRSLGPGKRNPRAQATIEILALNRKELVRGREIEMEKVAAAVLALGRKAGRLVAGGGAERSNPVNRVREQLKPWLPFVAARRAAARDALDKLGAFGQQLLQQLPELDVGQAKRARVGGGLGRKGRRTAYVTALSIRNFKVISKLDLTFEDAPPPPPAPTADGSTTVTATPLKAGWKVLLGENGTGKSSVLQALALALAGDREVKRRFLNADKLLRRTRGKLRRPREGSVTVTLSNGETIELRVTRRELTFNPQGVHGAQTYLRAYGATRNLPNTRPPASWTAVEATVRIIGIFDSNTPLCSAERWLAGLPKRRFDAVALALKDLLRLDKRDGFRRVMRRDPFGYGQFRKTVVDIGGATVELDELSDGYQSMIALAIDIMAGLPKTSTDFQSDTGIVLVDELGNHLHPRWRMEVVASLQRAFPRIQFIASTHEPLCLRGLAGHEIAVMRMENRVLHVDTDVPSPERFRVDQLLTSKLFGLHSTVDPTVERKFARYYALLAKTSRTAAEETERGRLSVELLGVGVLGHTRRDQLVYEVIDEYIAKEPTLPAGEAAALKDETKRAAAKRWRDLDSMLEKPR
jgi:uncharacterized protein (TIGR02646 family)